MTAADDIKRVRKQRKMTQEEMAKALSISTSHLAGVEQGKRPVGKALDLAFQKLFPSAQCQGRQEAMDTLQNILETKNTNTIWALVDFLKRL